MTDLAIDEFVDLEEIGRGGFGVVYTARQPSFDRVVAVKVLTLVDSNAQRRFDRERQALGKVSNHPHITPVFASGFTGKGEPYIVMELMRGGSLAERVARDGAMPWEEVLDLGVKLSGALATAHHAGILHRDLKPANILLSDYGEPRLADFGIASLEDGEQTKTGTVTASVAYAAPEVLDGRKAAVGADIYGLGATLFALVAGAPAFYNRDEESILAMVLRVARDPVPDLRPLGVPNAFACALEAAMAKAPADRPESAAAFGESLRKVQLELGVRQTDMVLSSGAGAQLSTATAEIPGDVPPNPVWGHQTAPASTPVQPAPASTPVQPAPAQPSGPAPGSGGPGFVGAPASDAAGTSPWRSPIRMGIAAIVLVAIGVAVAMLGRGSSTTDLAAGDVDAATEDSPESTGAPTDLEVGDPPTTSTDSDTDGGGALNPGEWQAVRPMPVARQQIPAVELLGTVWVAGGLTDSGVTASVEGYEIATNSWRTAPDLPIPVHHHMSTAFGGELVVLGGWQPDGALLSAITSDRVFALRDGDWVELPALLQPRVAGAAAAVGDLLIVTGGQDADGQLLDTTEVFDGQSWREVAPIPTPREHLAAASDGTALYAVGGRQLSADLNLATLERYEPETDTWTTLPDMPTARGGLAATIYDGHLIAVGGERPLGVHDEVEAFDIAQQSWTSWPGLPTPRHGLGVATSSSSLIAIGGALEATHSAPTSETEAVGLR